MNLCALGGPSLSAAHSPGHSAGRFTDRSWLAPHLVLSMVGKTGLHVVANSDVGWTLAPLTLVRTPALRRARSVVPSQDILPFNEPGVSVWYSREGNRVEQGFTLEHRPRGSGAQVTINLATSGNLLPVLESSTDIRLQGPRGRAMLSYSGLKVTDKDGGTLPAWFGVSGTTIELHFQDRSAAYPVTVDPWIAQASVAPPSGSNAFGTTVSSSSTGTTVLVGDPQGGSAGTGSATIYGYDGSAWSAGTSLVPPGGSVGFGSSVALSADGTTALIGDPLNYNRASETGGSATVYTLGPSGWSAGTELDPPSSALVLRHLGGALRQRPDGHRRRRAGWGVGNRSGHGVHLQWQLLVFRDGPRPAVRHLGLRQSRCLIGGWFNCPRRGPGHLRWRSCDSLRLERRRLELWSPASGPGKLNGLRVARVAQPERIRSHCRRSDGRNVWDRGGDGIQRERIILVIGYFAECPELGHRIRRFGRPLSDRGRGPCRRPGNLRWWSSLDLPGHWNLVIGHVADRSELGRSFRVVSRPLWSGTDGHRGRSGRWQLLRGSHRV